METAIDVGRDSSEVRVMGVLGVVMPRESTGTGTHLFANGAYKVTRFEFRSHWSERMGSIELGREGDYRETTAKNVQKSWSMLVNCIKIKFIK